MSLQDTIQQAQDNAADLEQIYRQAKTDGEIHTFKDAIGLCLAKQPDHTLWQAWAHRLDLLPDRKDDTSSNHWPKAIGISLILGILYLLLGNGQPPAPFPIPENPYFWLGWSPCLALAILTFFATINPADLSRNTQWGAIILAIALLNAFLFWGQTDIIAILAALHLPVIIWAMVGTCVIQKYKNPAIQFHAFAVKSVETILAGGIYFGAFMIFMGLTAGIFQVMGIETSDSTVVKFITWAVGTLSLLSLASVYTPTASPSAQNWTSGLTYLLNILTRLLLPLVLGVLAIYILYFIPAYFWRPFEEREVLIVYNATILAILVLIALAIAYTEGQTPKQEKLLRHALHALSILTSLLNLYALTAIVYRTYAFGLTPNRYVVLGWNIITLIIFVTTIFTLWRAQSNQWIINLRETLARRSILIVVWAIWVILILPLSF